MLSLGAENAAVVSAFVLFAAVSRRALPGASPVLSSAEALSVCPGGWTESGVVSELPLSGKVSVRAGSPCVVVSGLAAVGSDVGV
jgi:hypothetical protein